MHKEIIAYLNEKTGKKYRYQSAKTQRHINARIHEKFELKDFKDVIDHQCNEWSSTNMSKYLRPETLFGTKFEGYLNDSFDSASDEMSQADMMQMIR